MKAPAVWLGVCALLALASVAATVIGPAPALRWDAALWPQRPWTLWTAALTHLTLGHLLSNLLALGAIALLGWQWRLRAAAVWAWLLAWPLSTAALLLWPAVGTYSGLSGLIHAGVGVISSFGAIYSVAKPWNFCLLAGLVVKLLSEAAWVHPVVFSPDWGFNVVLAAHLGGALAGLLCGGVFALLSLGLDWRRQQSDATRLSAQAGKTSR